MSEAATAEAELVNVDGVEIPAWAERTACVLAFRGVRVLAALRDAHTGRPALIIHPRSRQALPVNLHTAMGFASWVAAALRTMGFEALDEDAFDDAEVKPGNVHVRAEYDACADVARAFIFGMEDATLPPLVWGAMWLECDVDAPPVSVGEA